MNLKLIALVALCLTFSGCQSGEKKASTTSTEKGPKTSYGQAVDKAKGLANSEKDRAKKIEDDLNDDSEEGDEGGE